MTEGRGSGGRSINSDGSRSSSSASSYPGTEDGAPPNYNYFTVTYDLKNGREIKLSDPFKPDAKYIQVVSAYSIRDLQSRKDPESGENMGLA